MVPMCAMLLSTYLNAQIIFLLDDPSMFDVNPDKIGQVSGLLIFVSLPGAIIGTAFVGFVYDIAGRKLTLFTSFFIGSLLIAVVPWTSPYVTPWLLIVRCLIQLCLCAPAASPLSGDYIHKEHIGKGVAMQGCGIVIGEVLSMGILFRVTADFRPWLAFATCGCVGVLFSFFFLIMVKEP